MVSVFPKAALELFIKEGITKPHEPDHSAPPTHTQRRYASADRNNLKRIASAGEGHFDYGKAVDTKPCAYCSRAVEVPGTSIWWGKGKLKKLNGVRYDAPTGYGIDAPVDHDETGA